MRRVILVTGPPCAGKTSYVAVNAQPGDTVLDQDQLGPRAMRTALATIPDHGTTWVIRCAPGPTARAALVDQFQAEHIHLEPARSELSHRAARRPNPRSHHAAITSWYRAEQADQPARQPRARPITNTVAKWQGRKGRPWRALCEKVYADPDETRCIRCKQPVDKTLSIVNAPPELKPMARSVDHIIAIEQGGDPLSRDNVGLAHFGCNSRHGAHVRWAKHKPGHRAPAQRMTCEW